MNIYIIFYKIYLKPLKDITFMYYIRMTDTDTLPNTSTSDDTRYAGRVKWFNNKAGYGFISSTKDGENSDIFVHHSALSTTVDQFRYLMEGEYVEFSLSSINSDDEKVSALDVKGLNGGKLMCETRNDRKFNSDLTQVDPEMPRRPHSTHRPGRGPRGPRMVIPSPDGDGTEWELVRRRTSRPTGVSKSVSKSVSTPSFQS